MKTLLLAATVASTLSLSSGMAFALGADSNSYRPAVYASSVTPNSLVTPTPAKGEPQLAKTWDNVVISHQIGDCGLHCLVGIAD
jgi:hypothetical protein